MLHSIVLVSPAAFGSGLREGSVLCGDRFGPAVGKRRRVGNKAGRLRIRAVRLLPFWLFNEPVVEMIAVRTNTIR